MNNELASNRILSENAAKCVGYCSDPLSYNGKNIHFGKHVIPARYGGLDHAPGEVEEVRLVVPVRKRARKNDGATIQLSTKTPFQKFCGTRVFAEWTKDNMLWLGEAPTGETVMIHPSTTYSLTTRKNEGSVIYGRGWIGCWIGNGKLLELCIAPKFREDGTVGDIVENDLGANEKYWRMWRVVKGWFSL